MGISAMRKAELEELCRKFRVDVIKQLRAIQSGHPGGSLSIVEIITALYFEKANISPENMDDPGRDRVVLSKGHAAPILYRALIEKGFMPPEEYSTLRQLGSRLQGHPSSLHTPGVEISSGPLGISFAAALGMACALKADKINAYVYVLLGDGEINEGVVWEAAMSAYKFKTDNLIAILDRNDVQLDGASDDVMPLLDVQAKWRAFGWNTISCDGHDVGAICDAIDQAKANTGAPSIIIARTVKGKGVSFMEGKHSWHGGLINDKDFEQAMAELGGEV